MSGLTKTANNKLTTLDAEDMSAVKKYVHEVRQAISKSNDSRAKSFLDDLSWFEASIIQKLKKGEEFTIADVLENDSEYFVMLNRNQTMKTAIEDTFENGACADKIQNTIKNAPRKYAKFVDSDWPDNHSTYLWQAVIIDLSYEFYENSEGLANSKVVEILNRHDLPYQLDKDYAKNLFPDVPDDVFDRKFEEAQETFFSSHGRLTL